MIAAGTSIYDVSAPPITAQGVLFTDSELTSALGDDVGAILRDELGSQVIARLLTGLATTQFAEATLRRLLSLPPVVEDWRFGEAIGEAYLVTHRRCDFPWPSGRDARHPDAVLPGADIVGFQHAEDGVRFAFAEVKTSGETRYPPSAVVSRSGGLLRQLERLRDVEELRHQLVRYLAFRAPSASWELDYLGATARYLEDPTDVSLIGLLVRDVEPSADDLRGRAPILSAGCPVRTRVELFALYFPIGAITG